MKTMKRILGIGMLASVSLAAQGWPDAQLQVDVDRAMAEAKAAMDGLNMPEIAQLKDKLKDFKSGPNWKGKLDHATNMLDDLQFDTGGFMAFAPQTPDERAREAAERVREAQDRVRESRDRVRENEDRNIDTYRDGTSAIDDRRYERAVDRFDRVIENKWSRSDGAYYWKAYALNKLGKREEALAALAEIPKQFPQSRWINDAKALQVEIQQAAGTGASPENQSDEDLKLIAINALVNSEPDRAVPLLEKVINDPKNNLGIKGRALYVLAQIRSDKAHDIVAQYAKGGSNQDLQIRAVSYLGAFRSKDSQQTLSDVYAANTDIAVRRAVLRSMMASRDAAHLLNAAKSEQNVDLRREAIRDLGMMRASAELGQLYSTESNADLKEAIIESIWLSRDTDKLIDIAKNEKDARLRSDAIRRLGLMREPKAADTLAAMYASESDKAIKSQIVNALWQDGACKQLVDAIRNEKDPALKVDGVHRLGQMKGCKEATDYLMELISK
jgi:tetratricopeptide (TPR) repeat protein